ncbi:hypothetical protein [Kurthia zopfii]|uniref:hypothetical protein n=1 Tax=Kurthia zopfii TaxID=1650 RepID=UPI000F71EAAC|nr:hypothetical protein [Kurthia zopfii]VEI04910.1 Uncharacterised protein [Kurthia zopfii]
MASSSHNLEFPEDARVLIAVSSMDDLHDEAQIVLSLPIYFRFTDEEDALNLVTGEW